MTDTHVEKLMLEKFLELGSLEAVPKCFTYYQNNKLLDNTEVLPSFISFKPDSASYPMYPDYTSLNPTTKLPWTEDEIKTSKKEVEDKRNIIDEPFISSLIEWYGTTYQELYGDNEDDDNLYDEIKKTTVVINEFRNEIKNFNRTKDINKIDPFPNVAFPNEPFQRPVDSNGDNTSWYAINFIPGMPIVAELGTKGRNRWVGILQVDICVPKTKGTEELNDRYDEIFELFRGGTYVKNHIRIVRTYRRKAFDEDDFYFMPVTVEWTADLQR